MKFKVPAVCIYTASEHSSRTFLSQKIKGGRQQSREGLFLEKTLIIYTCTVTTIYIAVYMYTPLLVRPYTSASSLLSGSLLGLSAEIQKISSPHSLSLPLLPLNLHSPSLHPPSCLSTSSLPPFILPLSLNLHPSPLT